METRANKKGCKMNDQATSLAELRDSRKSLTVEQKTALVPGFSNAASFELLQQIAKPLAQSQFVPQQFQGNIGECLIALEMAQRMGAHPLAIMQSLYVVHGRPAWSSTFCASQVSTCGRFSDLEYEFEGDEGNDNWGCRAVATSLKTGRELRGTLITIGMAKKAGWYDRKGSHWQLYPEQMLRYRASAFWVRAFAPNLILGMHTADEVRDGVTIETQVVGNEYTPSDLRTSADKMNEAIRNGATVNVQKLKERQPETPQAETPATKSVDDKTADWVDDKSDSGVTHSGPWPQELKELDGTITIVDSAGAVFDQEVHVLGHDDEPSMNKDGTFRARRGMAAEAAKREKPPF